MTWLGLDSWPYGIKHVVEEPRLLELLQAWSSADENSQEEAEMKVSDKFRGDLLHTSEVRLSMGRRVEGDQLAHSKVRQRGDVGVRLGRPENSDGRDWDLRQQKWRHLDGPSYNERRRRVDKEWRSS